MTIRSRGLDINAASLHHRPFHTIVAREPRKGKRIRPLSRNGGAPDAPAKNRRPGRKKTRRQQHGSSWHWKQTDTWYYTLPGTKKRIALIDEDGLRIRGIENKKTAQLALARVKLAGEWQPTAETPVPHKEWLVAKVCSEYLGYCERGRANKSLSSDHCYSSKLILNDLCSYCGALPVSQLKKGHIRTWVENHTTWRSSATQRAVLAVVIAAFNYSLENHDVPNPIKGLKKPPARPRLHSLNPEDEKLIYSAASGHFRDFLFAALHTGLRPFCELARLTADDVEVTPRGMMWRVYSSKTKKTRKIPVRNEVAALTRKLIKSAPEGSGTVLFRTSTGKPWSKVNGVTNFLAIRRKLGWAQDNKRSRYSTYSCRHTFAHRMLSGYWNSGVGCSIETLAELMGDTPKVAYDHYGKEWAKHYQDPLWAAIGATPRQVGQQGAAGRKPSRKPKRSAK